MNDKSSFNGFLGVWDLIPESCQYEQGDPPISGSYEIVQIGEKLEFNMRWTEENGQIQEASFQGKPDGEMIPFAGGELADALSITLVSSRELNSSAFYQGKELMTAQRQLDDSGEAMRITQVVRLPDGQP